MKVLVTGGTGFVGSNLVGLLISRGHKVTIVSRTPNRVRNARSGIKVAAWPPDLSGIDAVVHLAGSNLVGKRWSSAYKDELRSSRIDTTQQLVQQFAKADPKPPVFVCGSAIGYYGSRPGEQLDEASTQGDDFLAKLCGDWEAVAQQASGTRVVRIRTGVVLGPDGGALAKMITPFRLGVGGPLASGRQMFSWIHQYDLAQMILWAIENDEVDGILNGTGPNPVTAKQLAKTLGRILHRPSFMPAPKWALRIVLGEVVEALAADQHVLPKRALERGFTFKYTELEGALRELLQRYLINEQV
ncbi:MAG: hypothetical protein ACI841_001636 [Planctomycetota bacterium]|jgi:uncharacterized protein (TIGR01777 family)